MHGFFFVGARSKSTQLPDFLSRCLSIRLDQLPKKTQQISLPGASVSQYPFGVPSALGKNRTLSAISSKDADQSLAHTYKKSKKQALLRRLRSYMD